MKSREQGLRNVNIDELEEGDVYTVKGINLYDQDFNETAETGTVTGNGYSPRAGGESLLCVDGYSGSAFR